MARSVVVLAIVATVFAAPPALAEDSAQCELHVWPAPGIVGTRHSLADHVFASGVYQPNFFYIGPGDPNTSVQTSLPFAEEPLTTAEQIEVLKNLPIAELMGVSDYRVIIHVEALDGLTVRKLQSRYVETEAPCYADLVLSDVVFSLEYSRGQNLKSFIHFRDFADGVAPVRHLSTWVQTKLERDRTGKKADILGSNEEMPGALASNFQKFSGYLKKEE